MFQVLPSTQIVLASNSPRRKELLQGAGIPFEVIAPSCEELAVAGETPAQMVERLSLLKAGSVSRRYPRSWIIAADTVVVMDGDILGKPLNSADAERMLARIQGRVHEVYSGVALACAERNVTHVESHRTEVEMVAMDAALIRDYVDTREPLDKAGAYAIQGIGAALVKSIQGSYTNVVGLNLAALISMLRRFGVVDWGD